MILRVLLLFIFCLVPTFGADSWRAHTNPFPIRSAVSYKDGVLLATDGGLRYRTLSDDEIYTSSDGLETTVFFSLASSENGVYAVSEFGAVAFQGSGERGWRVLNRSFVNNRIRAVPDMALAVKNILVIGFENRMAFFDTEKKASILTIDRIADVSLRDVPIMGLRESGDSLYVVLDRWVYARKMDWLHLDRDVRLADPASWKKVTEASAANDTAKVVFDGKVLRDSVLYDKGRSRVKWMFKTAGSKGYLVGSDLVLHYDGKKLSPLTFSIMSHIGKVYEMQSLPGGGIFAASFNGLFASHDGRQWGADFPLIHDGLSNVLEAEASRMRALSLTSDGFVLYHIWGLGFYLFSDYGKKLVRKFEATDGELCMDHYLEDYTVSVATTVAPDSLGFLTTTASNDGYSLLYISLDGKMSCLSHVGSTPFAGPIWAEGAQGGSIWNVYVGSRKSASYASEGGLEKFEVVPPSKNSGRLSLKGKLALGGLDGGAPIDISLDRKRRLLWIVTNNILGYHELEQDTIKQPSSMKGLMGAEYSSVEVDVQGNVWLGTSNQGAYRLSRVRSSNDTLSVMHFVERDGLIKNRIYDMAIDPVHGMAWFSHENGLTVYSRNDLRNAESMMTDSARGEVFAFPNPFRLKIHSQVTIDNIEESASVSIFNRGGALIRYFSGSDVLGGRVDWDGLDKGGKLVVPGVYYYVVKGSSKVKKGKIIVIR